MPFTLALRRLRQDQQSSKSAWGSLLSTLFHTVWLLGLLASSFTCQSCPPAPRNSGVSLEIRRMRSSGAGPRGPPLEVGASRDNHAPCGSLPLLSPLPRVPWVPIHRPGPGPFVPSCARESPPGASEAPARASSANPGGIYACAGGAATRPRKARKPALIGSRL